MSNTDLHCLLAGVNFEIALFGQEVRSTLFSHLETGVLIIVATQPITRQTQNEHYEEISI